MIHHRNRNIAIMKLAVEELERKVSKDIIIKVAVDELSLIHI